MTTTPTLTRRAIRLLAEERVQPRLELDFSPNQDQKPENQQPETEQKEEDFSRFYRRGHIGRGCPDD